MGEEIKVCLSSSVVRARGSWPGSVLPHMYGVPVCNLYGHFSGLRGSLRVRGIHCSVFTLQEWTHWVPGIGKLTSLSHKQGYWLVLWEDLVSDMALLPCQAALGFLRVHPAHPSGLLFMFCLSTTSPQKPQPLIL